MKFNIADFIVELADEQLHNAIKMVDGFQYFYLGDTHIAEQSDLTFFYGTDCPEYKNIEYSFIYHDVNVKGHIGTTANGFRLDLNPADGEPLNLWSVGDDKFYLAGNFSPDMIRFALWVGFGIYISVHGAVAIHSSAILYKERVVIFLGASGTGKSTHTRLWRESITQASLLNDDSPIVRSVDGKVWVYGSPWSGKTPCYRNERYELAGCVRLSQAPYNKIVRLNVLQAYSALHPSAPPQFAYNNHLYDGISKTLGDMIANVPLFHLECLPNNEAAELSCKTIFGE